MKTTLFAAAAALSLVAAAAQAASGAAGVGNGEPFPFRAPGMTVAVSPRSDADTGSIAYPDLAGRASQVVTAGVAGAVPLTGSQAGVETANSLPRGFQAGTVAYAQEQSVQRYVAAQAAQRYATAQAAQRYATAQAARSGRIVQTAQAPSGKPRG